jgi:hypothetical protein
VPAPNSDFIAIAAGYNHSLGLKADGSIVAWGSNILGESKAPLPNSGFVAMAAGQFHNLGLKADGSIVAWGDNSFGQCDIPAPNADFVAVAAGDLYSLGLKVDGSIMVWGANACNNYDVPLPNSGFVAVAAGEFHSLGLKADGSVVAWGKNDFGQCNVPTPNTSFFAVTASENQSLGLKGNYTLIPRLVSVISPNGFQTLDGGSVIDIHWKNYVPTAGTAVKLELWDGEGWVADLGYGWDPDGETTTTLYLPLVPERADYRIRAISTWDPALKDDSDAGFSILGGPVRVEWPAGGEVWRVGSLQEIQWLTNPLISGNAVGLELWRRGQWKAFLGVDWDIVGHGVYSFRVPAVASGTDYTIRATSLWQPEWFGESAGFVTIINDGAQNAIGERDWMRYR